MTAASIRIGRTSLNLPPVLRDSAHALPQDEAGFAARILVPTGTYGRSLSAHFCLSFVIPARAALGREDERGG
ncbi:MAG: hypothetical protein RDA78_29210 [Roseibium sp.]|uniref:hypothetical protein n=1 Tax=Roseibium sp. TaxID=1936156 RepID=UPI003D9C2B3B